MTIDIFFEGNDGTEDRGSIVYENGKLTGSTDYARKLISKPLAVGPVQAMSISQPPLEIERRAGGEYWIDPAKYPEAFMQALPWAISSSRRVAQLRDENIAASLEVPIELG